MGQGQKITLFIILIGQVRWTWGSQELYTSYGELCMEMCDKHEYGYFWCTTEIGWDYCSISENMDYKGFICRDDHPCGKYGKSYSWCYTKAGSWGYCGLTKNTAEQKTLSYTSSKYQSECSDECLYDEKSKYFWCNTDKGWDYCSPLPDVTYKNEPCQSDHSCGTHGSRYTWCRTDSGYDYCGVIVPGGCKYSFNNSQSNITVLLCTQFNRGKKLETKFHPEPDSVAIADGSPWRKELTSLIARWKNGYLADYPISHVVTTESLHIDLRGLVNREDLSGRYYQVEIKVDARKIVEAGRNPVVAQVLVPVENAVPSRYVRMAFTESFRRRARISLEVTATEPD